jgi:hypothetical protein
MDVWRADRVWLAKVPIVTNGPLATRDFVLEFLSVHSYVMGCCWLGTLEPNKRVLVHVDAEFVCQSCLIELVGVKGWILAVQWMLWLIYGTMHPIDGEEEERGSVVIE